MDELQEKHIARFPEWLEKWTAVGLSTDRIDKKIASESALTLYDKMGMTRPSVVLHMDSPYGATYGGAYAVIQLAGLEDGLTYEECEGRIKNVDRVLFQQVADQVTAQMQTKFPAKAKHVSDPDLFMIDLKEVNPSGNLYGGAFYVSWVSFVTFLRDVMNFDDPVLDPIEAYEALCKNSSVVWWHEDVVAISDKPLFIKLDDEERLHSETTAAIEYADGWGVHSWHGVSIPSEWIKNPSTLTAKVALTWEDIEQRRCAAEILGWHKVLDELNAVVIDDDGDPEIGILLEVDLPDVGKERFLKVQCGTGRTFALPVPPDVQTALEAQSWTWGIDETEFLKPEVRT